MGENMDKTLPFSTPLITSYQGIANLLGILQAYPNTEGWIYNNYIQLIYYENFGNNSLHLMSGSLHDLETGLQYIGSIAYCPYINYSQINRNLVASSDKSCLEFLYHAIEENHYISLWLHEFNIPECDSYLKHHTNNPFLLYGYNNNDNTFWVSGFFKHGKYQQRKISSELIIKAIKDMDENNEYCHYFKLYKYRPVDYCFDKKDFCAYLYDYINSTDHTQKFSFIKNKKYWYGLSYYACINKQLMNKNVDIRLYHNLYDHKIMMRSRLTYFLNKHIISLQQFEQLNRLNEELIIGSKKLRDIVLKYILKYRDPSNRPIHETEKIYTMTQNIYNMDKKFMEKLLCSINSEEL